MKELLIHGDGSRDDVFAIWHWFDYYFKEGNFTFCDSYIKLIDPWEWDEDILVAVITATRSARDKLPHREQFVKSCQPVFEQWMSREEAENLIDDIL